MDSAVPPDAAHGTAGDRLDSWKEIAAFLGRGVTTVQRWERDEGLPVRRQNHVKRGSVYALKSEIDAWRAGRELLTSAPEAFEEETAPEPGGRSVITEPTWNRQAKPGFYVGRLKSATWLVAAASAGVGIVGGIVAMAPIWPGTVERSTPPEQDELSSSPRPLASEPGFEGFPSLSPDGSLVVYTWSRPADGGPSGLFVRATTPAGQARRLTDSGGGTGPGDAFAAWSPDGERIAFLRPSNQAYRVWVIRPDGSQGRDLTSTSGIPVAWTADGQSLLISDRNSASEPLAIYRLSIADKTRTRVTTPPAGSRGDLFAAASPDGRSVAFARFPNNASADLFVAPSTGGAAVRRTHDGVGILGVTFTSDSEGILFSSFRSAGSSLWHVWRSGARGEEPTLVTGAEGGVRAASLSRSTAGQLPKLAYQVQYADVNVWRIDVVSGAKKPVANATMYDDWPAASPDGSRIAFASNRTGHNEIWVADADGSNPSRLTFRDGPLTISPSWSPDGRRIAFVSSTGVDSDIFVVNADGTSPTRITTEPSEEGSPSWSNDGRWLYFRSDRGGRNQIWRQPVAGGTAQRVTLGEGFSAIESPDGRLVYFVRGHDLSGLWSIPIEGGAERSVLAGVGARFWAVTTDGILFYAHEPGNAAGAHRLKQYSFDDTTVTDLHALPAPHGDPHEGVAAPRDGRYFLWTQTDRSGSDLMFIDRLRLPSPRADLTGETLQK